MFKFNEAKSLRHIRKNAATTNNSKGAKPMVRVETPIAKIIKIMFQGLLMKNLSVFSLVFIVLTTIIIIAEKDVPTPRRIPINVVVFLNFKTMKIGPIES